MRAQDADGISELLAEHHEPVLAFAYADRKGRGGVQVAGWRADRPLPTGLVPVQGRLRSFDWKDRLSLARLPHVELDARKQPWALALDQSWSSRAGLDQTEWLWRPGDRARRLERTLTERLGEGRIDLRGAAELFLDDRAERAPRVAAAIVAMARQQGPLPVEAQEIATLLERWDGTMRSESAGAAAYQLVLEHLLGALLREPFGEALFARYVAAPHVEPAECHRALAASRGQAAP